MFYRVVIGMSWGQDSENALECSVHCYPGCASICSLSCKGGSWARMSACFPYSQQHHWHPDWLMYMKASSLSWRIQFLTNRWRKCSECCLQSKWTKIDGPSDTERDLLAGRFYFPKHKDKISRTSLLINAFTLSSTVCREDRYVSDSTRLLSSDGAETPRQIIAIQWCGW